MAGFTAGAAMPDWTGTSGPMPSPLWLIEGMSERDLPAAGTLSEARLASIGPHGKLQFQTNRGELALVPADMVRWSTPRDLSPARCLILTDGSRLVFSEPWDQRPMILLSGDEVSVHSGLLDECRYPEASCGPRPGRSPPRVASTIGC